MVARQGVRKLLYFVIISPGSRCIMNLSWTLADSLPADKLIKGNPSLCFPSSSYHASLWFKTKLFRWPFERHKVFCKKQPLNLVDRQFQNCRERRTFVWNKWAHRSIILSNENLRVTRKIYGLGWIYTILDLRYTVG